MTKLTALYQTAHIRQCEQYAVQRLGLAEEELMERAGQAAFKFLISHYPHVHSIAVCCGGGNNGGDGYVLARLAAEQGLSVTLYCSKPIDTLPPAARLAANAAMDLGLTCHSMEEAFDERVELIVDALLGIGLSGRIHADLERIIAHINASGVPVLALDVPSGLNADTGEVLGACITADRTITFIAEKIGMYTGEGPDHCGMIQCYDLGLSHCLPTDEPPAYLLDQHLLHTTLKPRKKNSHKGLFGHVLIIGGGPGMPGAAYLAAEAALRTGAGMVTLASHPDNVRGMLPGLPEVMVHAVKDAGDLRPLLKKCTVCAIGPGLGENAWAKTLFAAVIAEQIPLVLDASALRLLAAHPQYDDNWVLTPHPGEAACLLKTSTTDVQRDRLNAAARLQQRFGGTVVLKGVGSFVYTSHKDAYLCAAGNPGMASAGMGDVLTGVIAGLIAQGLSLDNAAELGVWLHAKAGDSAAAKQGMRGLLASDVMPFLRQWVNLK